MARAQTRLAAPEILDIDPDTGKPYDEPEESLQADQDKQLDEIISEFEAGEDNVTYRASINRVPDNYKKGGKEEWCADIDSSQIVGVRQFLRDKFGSGIYRIRVFKNNKQVRQFDYHIAKPVPGSETKLNADNPAIQAIMEQMRSLQEQNQRMMERLISGNGPAQITGSVQPVDPLSMMEKMMGIIAPLLGARVQQDPLDTFFKASEFIQNMKGGDGGSEDNIYSVIKVLAGNPALGEVIAQRRGQPMRRALSPGNQLPQNGAAIPQQNNQIQPAEQLTQNIRYLISKAERDSDPGLYAEWLLDNTDQRLWPMLNNPNLLDQLSTNFPRMVPVRHWFEELVNFAREAISQNAGPPNAPMNGEQHNASGAASVPINGDPGRESGHDSHPQADGETGAPSAP